MRKLKQKHYSKFYIIVWKSTFMIGTFIEVWSKPYDFRGKI